MAKQTFTTGQVLTAAQMTSLQQTAMLGGAASAKTASYTLVAADAGTAISMNNAGATTITVNTGLFAAGDTVHITNLGAGVCTITAGTATVNSSASLALAQYESGFLDFTSTGAAIFVKGAGAAASGGGMTLLSTTSLSGTEVTISSINQTYNNLIIIGTGITWNTGSTRLRIEPNAVETSGTYSGVLGAVNNRFDSIIPFGSTNFASNADSAFLLTINDYTSAAYKPTIYMGANPTDNSATTTYFGGLMTTTSAITSIKIVTNLGTPTLGGTVRIYGVK